MSSLERDSNNQLVRPKLLSQRCLLWAAVVGTTLSTGMPVIAEQKSIESYMVEEVVVTARKREETMQDVPISISAYTGNDLAARGAVQIKDLENSVPNVSWAGSANVAGTAGIRGIVSNTRNVGFESGMGVYIDGVSVGRPMAFNQDLPDIAQLEVLRGPQGTLFGKNTIAGAINIRTIKPSDELIVKGTVSYGEDDESVQAFIAGPLVEGELFGKLSVFKIEEDGYLKNTLTGNYDQGFEREGLRGGLRWTPSDELEVNFNFDYTDEEASRVMAQSPDSPDPFIHAQDFGPQEDRELKGFGLTVDWDISEYTLTSVTGFRNAEDYLLSDDDGGPFIGVHSDFNEKADNLSQELRLTSPSNGSYDYLIGLYYEELDATAERSTNIFNTGALSSDSDLERETVALFVSGNLYLTEALTLNGGLRYTQEDRGLVFTQGNTVPFLPNPNFTARLSDSDNAVSGNLALTYVLTNDTNVYVSAGRGFKGGGYNADITPDADIAFDPEYIWSYEAGVKSILWDKRIRLNASMYFSEVEDVQVSTLVGTGGFKLRNAGSSEVTGFEVEMEVHPNENLEFGVAIGYADTEYTEFAGCAFNPGTGQTFDCEGNQLIFAPEWNGSVHAQYSHPVPWGGELVARADWSYTDEQLSDPSGDTAGFNGVIDSYDLLNARLGYVSANERWRVFLWGKNLTDETYESFRWYLAPIDQENVLYGRPRTVGVELSFQL